MHLRQMRRLFRILFKNLLAVLTILVVGLIWLRT